MTLCDWVQVMVLLVLGIVGFSWFTVVACYGPTMVKGPPLSSLGCAMAILWFTAVVGAGLRARGRA